MKKMGIFSVLAMPLGVAMRWLYQLVNNYGWTIIIFTFLVRILMFPLTLKQQKSTARMSAFQPMIQEIQKKWANDKNRQNAEMQKFYEENNIKMSAGCAPMLINMLVLFGIIAVIQQPLNYIVQVPAEDITAAVAIVQHYDSESDIGESSASYTQQSKIIGLMKDPATAHYFVEGAEVPYVDDSIYVLTNEESLIDGKIYDKNGEVTDKAVTMKHVAISADVIEKVDNFNFRFMGLNLADAPSFSNWVTLIMPILSLLTMIASQLIIMKTSPTQQNKGQMLIMTVLFGAMFGFYAFRVPAGFSLYYTVSNVVMTLQQFLVKRIYDPEKIRAEVEKEIEERRASKKKKKKVVVATEDGVIDAELSESELVKLRLQKARELDAKRYGEEEKADAALKKAKEMDEAKYGGDAEKAEEPDDEADADEASGADGETGIEPAEAAGDEPAEEPTEEKKAPPAKKEEPQADYKPGRRKRARQSKEKGSSFADEERAQEQKNAQQEKEAENDA